MSKIILPIYFINLFSQNKLNFSLTYAIIKFCYFYATFYFHFKYLFSLELYSLNLRRKKEKKEIDFSNLSYYNTYYTIFLNYHIYIVCGMLYHLSLYIESKSSDGNERRLTKKLCVDVTLRSCNYCHYCTITMCTTIVAPRAQASNQVSFSSGEQTIKCFFIISIPFSLLYIHIFVSHPDFESDKKKKKIGDNF